MSPARPIFLPAKPIPLLITIATYLLIWFTPPPAGVEVQAWHLLAIFVSMLVGIISKMLPMGGMGLIALTLLSTTKTLTLSETLSGFSNPLIWLIIMAFFVARCFIKTGLGLRIAYQFIKLTGHHTLGLSYALGATELFLAPAIPSNTARAGGIIYPVVRSIAESFDSSPDNGTARRMGSFLILNAYYINLITSAMFLTAMAPNPLIQSMAAQVGLKITWLSWAKAAIVPGLISFFTIPYFIYKVYPPQIKHTPHAKSFATQHLNMMGPVTRYEWITLVVFALLVFLWIFGDDIAGLDTTTSAFIGLAVLLLTGVLTWDDVKHEYEAWDVLIWFPTLLTMATYLTKLGFIAWFSGIVQYEVSGISWWLGAPILIGIYFYSHYFFASITAHVSSMYAAFLGVGIAIGAPPMLLALALGFCSSLMGSISHYGTGCAPILFGAGYVNLKSWWTLGFAVSLINLFIWVVIGPIWWKFLGHW